VYVLHALFTDGGSWELWAEDSGRPLMEPAGARGNAAVARRHPFAADPAVVADLLAAAGDEIAATVRGADPRGSVPLALPSRGSGPQASTGFARLLPDRGGDAVAPAGVLRQEGGPGRLRAWIVPTLVLEPRAGAALFAALGDERLATYDTDGAETDVPLGETVRYARAVAQFADTLVRRGEILPDLEVDEKTDEHHAVWRPVYALDSAAHRKALIDAMPPVFRAQLLDADLTGRPSADVLDGAVNALVDAYVIAALSGPHGLQGESLVTPRASNGVRIKTPVEELWLEALTSARGNLLDPDRLRLADAESLLTALDDWRVAAHGTAAGPVRTCFRLVAPPDGEAQAPDPRRAPTRRHGWSNCSCSRWRTPRSWPPRTKCGGAPAPRACCARPARIRAETCSPGSAEPHGCSRRSTPRCVRHRRQRSGSTRTAHTAS
jgi:hypothetical protein